MDQRWALHFLDLAYRCALMSKDPSTQVGVVIVGPDREIRSTGFNGFPRGIADTPIRLSNRDVKLSLMVHAEMNAILNAARVGTPMKGCTLFVAATDKVTGNVWGGPPCDRCVVEVIQAGIAEVVSYPFTDVPSRWQNSISMASDLLEEAGIPWNVVPRR